MPVREKEFGWSLLQLSSYFNHMDIVRWLVEEEGADVNKASQDGFTALMCAAKRGNAETFLYLMENGADVFAVNKLTESSLTLAVHNGHSAIVELLSCRGGPLELKGRETIGVRSKEPITTMFQLAGRFVGHHE